MDFISLIVQLSLIACAVGAPIGIFLVKPTASSWLKSRKLLFPVFLLFLTLSYTALSDCIPYSKIGCYSFKMFFVLLGMLQYIMFLGWFEYIWRRWHKQISWPLKKNFQYGVVSNTFIVISACMTILMVTLLTIQMILLPLFQGN